MGWTMAKNSGKAFELAIRKSFDAHGWWCLRITDNVYATGASVKTPADFIVVSPYRWVPAHNMAVGEYPFLI